MTVAALCGAVLGFIAAPEPVLPARKPTLPGPGPNYLLVTRLRTLESALLKRELTDRVHASLLISRAIDRLLER